jgi:hypothetical protein
VVGLATILHAAKFRDILRHTITRVAPGPAGDIVVAAFKQGATCTNNQSCPVV